MQTIAVSPIALTGEQRSAHFCGRGDAGPPQRLPARCVPCVPDPLPLGPYLDAQRGTENFDPLFRHEIGFVFFPGSALLVDTARGVTTLAEIEARRKTPVDDVERRENLAAAAPSIGDLTSARLFAGPPRRPGVLCLPISRHSTIRVVMLRPGGGEPRRMKRPHRLDERDKSGGSLRR